ncbi:L,D-transpeptidase [Luteimonas huabeiensis]|uniref:L,D-transpeptidase n=1 Tax=Luteimonas huabeiensis TaxID=1244513 RepID=UPI0009E00DAC|nr:L,D-transpeptidase [Luteimonas huabeiensis]
MVRRGSLRRNARSPPRRARAIIGARSPAGPPMHKFLRPLRPGDYLWYPEAAPEGPVVLVVSLDEQRAYAYRNGIAIGVSTISSGREGKETPTGVFTILQKRRDHRSNLYNDAPMPYMQRLTWDGIALHGGPLPGYPASHGCVRLPQAFAEKLFAVTRNGDTVVVAGGPAAPASLVHPAVLAPVDAAGRPLAPLPAAAAAWNDDADVDGPLSVLVSLAQRRVYALRDGVPVGEAALEVEPGFEVGGSVLMVVGSETEAVPSLIDPDRPRHRWTAYPLLGVDAESLAVLQLRLQQRPLRVDPAFAQRLYAALAPGATVLLTDLPAVRPDPSAQPRAPVLESDPGDGS